MSEYEEEREERDKGEQEQKKSDVDKMIMAMHAAEITRPGSAIDDVNKINQMTELYDDEIASFSELNVVEYAFGLDILRATNVEFMLERRSLDRKMLDALLLTGYR